MGRQMMCNAKQSSLIAPEQFGNQKIHTATNQALNKVLTYLSLPYQA
jgi:hypothetical protein